MAPRPSCFLAGQKPCGGIAPPGARWRRTGPLSNLSESENMQNNSQAATSHLSTQMQNTSHAVMAQRAELKNSLDDFPTPPWATRALVEHVITSKDSLGSMTCLEPACGRGHMSVALAGYFRNVTSYDVFDYRFGHVADFLKSNHPERSYDWVIT